MQIVVEVNILDRFINVADNNGLFGWINWFY